MNFVKAFQLELVKGNYFIFVNFINVKMVNHC